MPVVDLKNSRRSGEGSNGCRVSGSMREATRVRGKDLRSSKRWTRKRVWNDALKVPQVLAVCRFRSRTILVIYAGILYRDTQ